MVGVSLLTLVAASLSVTAFALLAMKVWRRQRHRWNNNIDPHQSKAVQVVPVTSAFEEDGRQAVADDCQSADAESTWIASARQHERLSSCSLRERLTVILTTSPVGRHPSTELIDEVIGSTQLARGVADCRLIIVCDGYRTEGLSERGDVVKYTQPKYRSGIVDLRSAENYEQYKATLRARASANLEVLELPSRHGFGFAVKAALEKVQTPYVLVLQHDRPFLRETDVPRLLAAMEADPARLKYVGLPTSTTIGHQYHVLSKYSIHINPFVADAEGLMLLPLIQWYDSAHVCETDYYRNFVFGPRNLVARGGFIEDKFGQTQLADIRRRGVLAAHPEYATFVAVGPEEAFGKPCVGHLDGRDPRNVKKFRFAGATGDSGS